MIRLRQQALSDVDDMAESLDYAIVGPLDSRVHEIRTLRFPYNTVCYVGRDFGDGVWRGCSGVLIGPRSVLTAGHCVYSHLRGVPPKRIRVSPGRSDRDTFPYGSVISREFYVPRRYIEAKGSLAANRKYYDYGLVVLPTGFPAIRSHMRVRSLSDDALRNLKQSGLITIAGYPGDKPTGTLWRHSERLKKITPRRLFYTVDTCPGHSGSPVWSVAKGAGGRSIIAVHTSGIVDEMGRSYGCSKKTVLAPPGRMNSGVRITSDVLSNIRDPRRRVLGKRPMVRLP